MMLIVGLPYFECWTRAVNPMGEVMACCRVQGAGRYIEPDADGKTLVHQLNTFV